MNPVFVLCLVVYGIVSVTVYAVGCVWIIDGDLGDTFKPGKYRIKDYVTKWIMLIFAPVLYFLCILAVYAQTRNDIKQAANQEGEN